MAHSDLVSADLLEQGLKLVAATFQWLALALHVIVVKDLIKVNLVLISVVDAHSEALDSESAGSSDSVHIVFKVSMLISTWSLCWHIEVDNNLDLWHVNTSSEQVSRDDHADLTRAELLNHLISLTGIHISKDDGRLEVSLSHHVVQSLSELPRVHEDHCLGHLAHSEDLLNELWLLAWLTSHFKLLNMIELQLLLVQLDLVGFRGEIGQGALNLITEGSREEDALHLAGQRLDVLCVDLLQLVEVLLLTEEDITLIDDEALESTEVQLARSALEVVGQLA